MTEGILFTIVLLIIAFICLAISMRLWDSGNELFIPLLFALSLIFGAFSVYTNCALQRADVKEDVIIYLVETGKLDMHISKSTFGKDKIYYYINDSSLVKLSYYLSDNTLLRKVEADSDK